MIDYHSWQLVNQKIISKKADPTLLKSGVSTLPIQFRPFFSWDNPTTSGQEIFVEYQNQTYICRLSFIEATNNTKIDLHHALRNKIRAIVPNFLNTKVFPYLLFHKIDYNHYSLTIEKTLEGTTSSDSEDNYLSPLKQDNVECKNSDDSSIPVQRVKSNEELREDIQNLVIKSPGVEKQYVLSLYDISARMMYKIIDACGIVVIKDKLYKIKSIPCVESLYQNASKIISEQIKRNGGFTHIKHVLVSYSSIEPDFFFYNPEFKNTQLFFNLVSIIVEECNQNELFHFVHDSLTIWDTECHVPHNIMGILLITSRNNDNILSKQLIVDTLHHFGSSDPYPAFCMSMGRSGKDPRPYFYQISEDSFISVESLNITEKFMEKVCGIVGQLFEEEDYVPYRDINDDVWNYYFKEILDVPWSPLLLRDILNNNASPYRSINSGFNQYSVPDAAIVKKDSGIETFADLVLTIVLLNTSSLPVEMSYQELRQMLVDNLILGPNEKKDNLFRSLDDLRFHWVQNNRYVIINRG